jgi:hypothetical protein
MNLGDILDGLQFKNDKIIDDDIRTEALVELKSIIARLTLLDGFSWADC